MLMGSLESFYSNSSASDKFFKKTIPVAAADGYLVGLFHKRDEQERRERYLYINCISYVSFFSADNGESEL